MAESSSSVSKRAGPADCLVPGVLAAVGLYFLSFALLHLSTAFVLGCDDVGQGVFSRHFLFVLRGGAVPFMKLSLRDMFMLGPYTGQAPQYLAALFIFLFSGLLGLHMAFKLTLVVEGLVLLASVFFVLRRVCGRQLALWTVFFLGTNSMFIQALRRGFVREEIFQALCLWLGLALVLGGAREEKRVWTMAGMFVFGVGLWAKMMFPGCIIGAVAGLLALGVFGGRILKHLLFPSLSGFALRLSAFLAGCAPLLWFNLVLNSGRDERGTLRAMAAPILQGRETGLVERLGWFADNLVMRATDLGRYAAGTLFRADYGLNLAGAALAGAAFLWCLLLLFGFARDPARRRMLCFVFVAYSTLFALSSLVVATYDSGHVLILVPFLEILCAAAAADLCARIKKPCLARAFAAVVVALWLFGNVSYEYKRLRGMPTRAGTLKNEFLCADMEFLLTAMRERGVERLYCTQDFFWPLKFFAPELNAVMIDYPLEERFANTANLHYCEGPWYFLGGGGLAGCGFGSWCRDNGLDFVREAVFDCGAGPYDRLYLFRVGRVGGRR